MAAKHTEPLSEATTAIACPTLWRALLVVILLRLIVVGALAAWEIAAPSGPHPDLRYYHGVEPVTSLWGRLFVKWDSYWYLNMVAGGYQPPTESKPQSNLAFAPLYPLLISLLVRLGMEAWLAGVAISGFCFIGMICYLYRLGVFLHSPRMGYLLTAYVSSFPSAWVFNMVYAESLFCLGIAGFFLHYLKGQYKRAGAFAFCLVFVRLAGLAVIAALAVDVARRSWQDRRICPGATVLLCSVVGLVCLAIVYALEVGDPAAFLVAGRAWFERQGVEGSFLPLVSSLPLRFGDDPLALIYLSFVATYAITSVVLLVRQRSLPSLFCAFYMLMLLKTPILSAQMRYLLPLFPVHQLLLQRLLGHRVAALVVIVGLMALQIILSRGYLSWAVIP